MEQDWFVAALWLGLAMVATLCSICSGFRPPWPRDLNPWIAHAVDGASYSFITEVAWFEISYGFTGRGSRVARAIHHRHSDHGAFSNSVPSGHTLHQRNGFILIGLLMTLLTERWQPHPNWRLVLVVGFLGGYTTFSSFEYESYRAILDGGPWLGLLNIVGSVALGYVAVWTGAVIAGHR